MPKNQLDPKDIDKLRAYSPKIFDIILSELGYEFSAVCRDGIIYSTPGMLLNLSSGDLTEQMLNNPEKLINDIIESGGAEPIPFDDLDEYEIKEILETIEYEISSKII